MKMNIAPTTWKRCTNSAVANIYNEVLSHADSLGYLINHTELYTFKSTRNFGKCITRLNESVIGLNEEFLNNPESCRRTCVHEIAHAIVPKSHHDWRWEQIGNKIGAKWGITVSRCSSESEAGITLPKKNSTTKYIVSCPKCGASWDYVKMAATVQHPELYRCGKCNSTLVRTK